MTSTQTPIHTEPRPRRRRGGLLVAGGIAVVFLVALAVGNLAAPPPKAPSADVGLQLDTALPVSIATLPLLDEFGHSTNLAALQGKVVVLTDFMTLCQEICPIVTAELNQIDQSVASAGLADKVQFVDISVDPDRDTPARLHAYRTFAQLQPNWTLLTGTSGNLGALWKYLGVSYSKVPETDSPPPTDWLTGKPLTFDINHSDVLLFLDKAGHERFIIEGMPFGSGAKLTPGELAFLDDEGRSNLTDNADASWTRAQATQVVSWLTKKHVRVPD
jgi:cytochrome oxidase Cu insertion factor (SCO1/SenC/PrrC family)